jgi:hypothetical protein
MIYMKQILNLAEDCEGTYPHIEGNDIQLTPVTMGCVKYCTATGVKVLLPSLPITAGREIFCNENGGSPDSTYGISR